MLNECLEGLNINPDGVYVDATFGGGGHSRAILERLQGGRLIAFDQDADAKKNAPDDERFTLISHNFRFMRHFLTYLKSIPVDGVLADLGISSHQIDEESRGFAHRFDAQLDMRMNTGSGITAAKLINEAESDSLAEVFREYGEIDRPGLLAKNIVQRRSLGRISTTAQLREVAMLSAPRNKENQYLSKVYQALRIAVNDEINALKEWLVNLPAVIKPGGRLVVMSYHSLEDRPVKYFIQYGNPNGENKKDLFGNVNKPFKSVTRGAVQPRREEQADNPRSRSAKLRIAERI